jgi:UDP-GlcNAc:undecaprenyl-phosphate GlcNAc-1-phosphate transferase
MRIACLTIAVCAAVALAFNLKGSLFSGSAGTYGIPMFLGLNAIALYHMSNGAFREEIPALWFWLPVADCLRLMIQRVMKGRSPFTPDRSHLHHVLERIVGRRGVLPAYLLLLAAPGVAALASETLGLAVLALCLGVYGMVFVPALARFAARTSVQPAIGVYPAE